MSEEDISFENHFKKHSLIKILRFVAEVGENIMIYKKKFLQGERLKRLNKTEWVVQIILGE